MFKYQKDQTSLDLHIKGLHKIFESMNTPRISIPDMPVERAKAYVVSGKNKKGYYVQIYLLLIDSNKAAIYSPKDLNNIHKKNIFHFQEEALNFAESMGFMMDDLNISEMSDIQRRQMYEDLPIFYTTPPPPSPFITTAMPVLNSQISKMNFNPVAHQQLHPSSFNEIHSKHFTKDKNEREDKQHKYQALMRSQKIQTLPIMTDQWLHNESTAQKRSKKPLQSEEKDALIRFLSYF